MSTPFGHGVDKRPPPQKTEKTRDFEKKLASEIW